MKNFMDLLKKENNFTTTENGAVAVKSTLNNVVDFFGTVGSLRASGKEKEKGIYESFLLAYEEDKELAIKSLFYTRDCRGGMGEKAVFKNIANRLLKDKIHADIILNNLENIVEFGSWKDIIDILVMEDKNEEDITNSNSLIKISQFIYNQLEKDLQSDNPSLLAKWLPTINSSREKTKRKARIVLSNLNLHTNFKGKNYRKICRLLRDKIDIVETHIAKCEFDKIEYASVASKCMLLNRDIFSRKDNDRFWDYLKSVEQGKSKIKSSVLFPSDITKEYLKHFFDISEATYDSTLELQWKALPNYIDKPLNAIPLIDTSGSMYGTPMNVSTALGVYISERNPSPIFKDRVLEFGSDVHFYDMSKKTSLVEKLKGYNQDCGSTNLEKCFQVILDTAVSNDLSQDELPTHLIIISDMQFDDLESKVRTEAKKMTLLDSLQEKFIEKGYNIPKIVFWNVDARHKSFPCIAKDGIVYASGYSPSILKAVLNVENFNPLDMIKQTVLTDRYKNVWVG